jgi:hypothetical protein
MPRPITSSSEIGVPVCGFINTIRDLQPCTRSDQPKTRDFTYIPAVRLPFPKKPGVESTTYAQKPEIAITAAALYDEHGRFSSSDVRLAATKDTTSASSIRQLPCC